jgi:hypothetical protein
VPPEQGSRGHHERRPALPRQDTTGRGEQDPVPPPERQAANAAGEHLELMSEDKQLGFPFELAAI